MQLAAALIASALGRAMRTRSESHWLVLIFCGSRGQWNSMFRFCGGRLYLDSLLLYFGKLSSIRIRRSHGGPGTARFVDLG